ncbi:MAG: IPTL-CTERM sorting domain-containing protein, partial [Thermoanaerobaculia bacterium]
DVLPANVTFQSATPSQGSCSGTTTVTCNLDTLANADGATITLIVNNTAASGATVTNTATVTAAESDPAPANNSSTANAVVSAAMADVAIAKSGPATVGSGADINYTITVTNAGPQSASGVVVTDALPATVAFQSATPSQGSCTGTTTVTCNLGTLANGANATIQLIVSNTIASGTVSNTATVTAAETDPAPANNSSTASTSVSAAIPTLSEWTLLALALALAAVALTRMRM